jgi:phage terminase small subunit
VTANVDEYGLKLKEREFADLYRGGDDEVRGNAKRCYMRIFPTAKETSAEVKGHQWLRKDKIDAYLKLKAAEITEECDINAKWLLNRLVDEAQADLADLYEEDGTFKQVKDWPLIWRQGLVTGIDTAVSQDKSSILKVKLSGRDKIKEMLGKHTDVQAFKEKEVNFGLTVILADKDSQA